MKSRIIGIITFFFIYYVSAVNTRKHQKPMIFPKTIRNRGQSTVINQIDIKNSKSKGKLLITPHHIRCECSACTTSTCRGKCGKQIPIRATTKKENENEESPNYFAKIEMKQNVNDADHSPQLLDKSIQRRTQTSSSGELQNMVLHEVNPTNYRAVIGIGTPPQQIGVCLDTGSSNLLISTTQCSSCAQPEEDRFNPKNSSSFLDLKIDLTIPFASGKMKSYRGSDIFTFGNLTIEKQEFGATTEITGSLADDSIAGILGLAYSGIQKKDDSKSTVFDNIMKQKKLNKNVFSFYFPPKYHQNGIGYFFLGGWDTKYFKGDINWHPNTDRGYWLLNMKSVKLGDTVIIDCPNDKFGCKTLLDTGSSVFSTPSKYLDPTIDKFVKAAMDSYKKNKTIPDLVFTFDDKEYSLPPEKYFMKQKFYDDHESLIEKYDKEAIKTMGPPFIAADLSATEEYYIIGDILMRKYFVIFDRDNDRMGLALAKEASDEQK